MNEPPALPPEPPAPAGQPPQPAPRRSLLPWFGGAGFLILAAALFWVWRHPSLPSTDPTDRLARQIGALEPRVSRLEQSPEPQPPDLAPLTSRVAALEQRPTPNLSPIAARLTALEQPRTSSSAPALVPDLEPLAARVTALEQRPQADLAGIETRLAGLDAKQQTDRQLVARVDALEASLNQRLSADHATVTHLARVQAVSLALDAGQKLGDLAGAPAALARFATTNPPTFASLRLSFPGAAQATLSASRPAIAKSIWSRLWAQAQDLVTIRQGDRLLVGDPAAVAVDHARTALEAGDLAAAVAAVASLQGASADAMANWLSKARALLEARTALITWAAQN